MAEKFRCGAELNSATTLMGGWATNVFPTAPTVSSTTVRSGSYAWRFNTTTNQSGLQKLIYNGAQNRILYVRFYLNIASLPDADTEIMQFGAGGITDYTIILETGGEVTLDIAGSPRGSSSPLSTGQWYRVEVMQDAINDLGELRLDGTTVVADTFGGPLAGVDEIRLGIGLDASVTGDIYMDDIVVNDDTGSFANTWPGEGEVIHLRPNADGDNTQFTRLGTDSGANWSQVEEVTPNDATDYVAENTLNEIDDYNCDATPAAIASDETITSVALGYRGRTASIVSRALVVGRIKASSGGTVEESARFSDTTTWHTFAILAPFNHPLVLYDLPGASTTEWTKTDLDAMQIGMRCDLGGSTAYWISAVWAAVHHVPAPPAAVARRTMSPALMSANVGIF